MKKVEIKEELKAIRVQLNQLANRMDALSFALRARCGIDCTKPEAAEGPGRQPHFPGTVKTGLGRT